jgi:hypothetical protein
MLYMLYQQCCAARLLDQASATFEGLTTSATVRQSQNCHQAYRWAAVARPEAVSVSACIPQSSTLRVVGNLLAGRHTWRLQTHMSSSNKQT